MSFCALLQVFRRFPIQPQPAVDHFRIEAHFPAAVRFDQRAPYQQRLRAHHRQRGFGVDLFRDNFTGFDLGRGAVEPFGDRAVAEEGQQAFPGPGLGEQAFGLHGVAGGG